MKRKNNLYKEVISMENLVLAAQKAQKEKTRQYGVRLFKRAAGCNLIKLFIDLYDKTFRTSEYKTKTITDPKERLVFKLPFFPDRIVHHAIMNVLQKMFIAVFTRDTYSCIPGRGPHTASYALREELKDIPGTQYCLKLDVRKFYPTIDHDILKQLVRKKIKDRDLLWLIDEIIDSAPGLPIGNYLSQYLANFYVAYFDHYIKEELRWGPYLRYADDIVALAPGKPELHALLEKIRIYFRDKLKLEIKGNYQIFPVAVRGIDFAGYPTFHDHVKVRKRTKKNFIRAVRYNRVASIPPLLGWIKHADTKHLIKTTLHGRTDQRLQKLGN